MLVRSAPSSTIGAKSRFSSSLVPLYIQLVQVYIHLHKHTIMQTSQRKYVNDIMHDHVNDIVIMGFIIIMGFTAYLGNTELV